MASVEHVRPNWDSHLQLVFSVLVGLSFSQLVLRMTEKDATAELVLLSVGAFFIVLDNWYQLFIELSSVDVAHPSEVFLYALALVPYSALPFTVAASNGGLLAWGPTRWMALNLAAVCLLDAARMGATAIRYSRHSTWTPSERAVLTRFHYYMLTAIPFAVVLSSQAYFLRELWGGAIVLLTWLAIRSFDTWVIPRAGRWVNSRPAT